MTAGDELLDDTAEELFESAPCGYLTTRPDGTIVRVNRTFEAWTGLRREDLLGRRRFQDLLTPGGRIYHETHYAPLLHMQGSVREIAVDIIRADGTRLPALVNSVVREDPSGRRVVRTTVFDATERRRYERELVHAREREHRIALELQRSLLSGTLPADEHVVTEVVYRPAERGLEVGGDWYDAFWLDATTVVAVVGDVVGRGLTAAATMGQLRSAARALATPGVGPAALLDGLDRFARRHEVGRMTTVAAATVDVATGAVRHACAGHPPIAVVQPDAAARLVWDGRSPPLDAAATLRPRTDGVLELAPGGALVLYTDGLVERRDRPVFDGLAALTDALDRAVAAGGPLAEAAVDDLLGRGERDDDVCALAVSRR